VLDSLRRPLTLPAIMLVLLVASLWLVIARTAADADLWGHLRFGLDTLASHSIARVDPYSFTADRAWLNHEWLAEVLMAIAFSAGGAFGLNLLKLGTIAGIAAIVYRTAREDEATPLHAGVLAGLVVFATYTRTQVLRPQLFSVALFCAALYLMRRFDRGRETWPLFVMPIVFVVWANMHGAWLVGLIALATWTSVSLVTSARLARWPLVACLAITAAATAATPYGVDLWKFLVETVRPARVNITDWKPLLELPPFIVAMDLLFPAAAVLACLYNGRPPLKYVAPILVLFIGTLKIGRVDAFLQAAVGLLAAPQILEGMRKASQAFRLPLWRRPLPWGGAVACALLGLGAWSGARDVMSIRMEGAWLPDSVTADYLKDHRQGSRVLTWFDWGEYAVWHLAPAGIRVSMDGRRETVYGAGVLADHWAFYAGNPEALDYPDKIGADLVWIPTSLPAVAALQRRGWATAFESERSIVLQRSGLLVQARGHSGSMANRVFPGP
jgi:hypothetical protein